MYDGRSELEGWLGGDEGVGKKLYPGNPAKFQFSLALLSLSMWISTYRQNGYRFKPIILLEYLFLLLKIIIKDNSCSNVDMFFIKRSI